MTEITIPDRIKEELKNYDLAKLRTLTLTLRQRCDLELIMNGGFHPLNTFMNQSDYLSVLKNTRLSNGSLWSIPIILDITKAFAENLAAGDNIALVDSDSTLYAILTVSECWQPDKKEEAHAVYGTDRHPHPGVEYLYSKTGDIYVSGVLHPIQSPLHFDFNELRHTPAELKQIFSEKNWHEIIAFQTRNPMHRAHQELTLRASQQNNAKLLIHPVVGMTRPGDIDYYARVRCYKYMLAKYPRDTAMLSLLPLAMRMAGPKEALSHAIIRKNYGCTHFIIGRDHAGPGNDSTGQSFYAPYAAQELVSQYEEELGIKVVPFHEMVYVKETKSYMPINQVEKTHTVLRISGTEFRRCLRERIDVPEWFSYPEIIAELRKLFPPKDELGFTLFFTGFSGAGKSTIARALRVRLLEKYDRWVSLLDGDIIRKVLSSELTFSKEHRELNVRRIGFVANEITKHRGIAICAMIAPYSETRKEVRDLISESGGFIEVYLSTPLATCEERNPKGVYTKARAGLIQEFTGISDPYEVPENPEIEIDTSQYSLEECVDLIIEKVRALGYLN